MNILKILIIIAGVGVVVSYAELTSVVTQVKQGKPTITSIISPKGFRQTAKQTIRPEVEPFSDNIQAMSYVPRMRSTSVGIINRGKGTLKNAEIFDQAGAYHYIGEWPPDREIPLNPGAYTIKGIYFDYIKYAYTDLPPVGVSVGDGPQTDDVLKKLHNYSLIELSEDIFYDWNVKNHIITLYTKNKCNFEFLPYQPLTFRYQYTADGLYPVVNCEVNTVSDVDGLSYIGNNTVAKFKIIFKEAVPRAKLWFMITRGKQFKFLYVYVSLTETQTVGPGELGKKNPLKVLSRKYSSTAAQSAIQPPTADMIAAGRSGMMATDEGF